MSMANSWELEGTPCGMGATAKVFRGVHKRDGRRVAVKRISASDDETFRGNFEIEKMCLQQLSARGGHRNVLKLHEVYETEKTWNLVLEYAAHGELFNVLEGCGGNGFDVELARTVFLQMLSGVRFMHGRNIVHRDLKPENLLLSEDYEIKVADLGMGCVVRRHGERLYTDCGSQGYVAPEVRMAQYGDGYGYDGSLADVWSMGVILFIFLAGNPPFGPNETCYYYKRIVKGQLDRFWKSHMRYANFSTDAMDLISRMLEPNPAKRITVDEILRHRWCQGRTLSKERYVAAMRRLHESATVQTMEDECKSPSSM